MKIGYQVVDITPVEPCYIGGHAMRTEKFKGVHDPMEMVVTWLDINGEKCLFLNADLSGFDYDFVHAAKDMLLKEFPKLNRDLIVLSATHTHTGPLFKTRKASQPADENYRKLVMDKVLEGAKAGYGKEADVSKVTMTKGESYGFYGNRNSADRVSDQWIYVFEFKNEKDENIAAWTNLSTHPTVISPEEYNLSGDLMGALRRKLADYLGVTPMMMNGNAGDMSNRLFRQNNDFAELERVAEGIFQQIKGFTDTTELKMDDLKVKHFTHNVKYRMDVEMLKAKFEQAKKDLEVVTAYDDRKWIISELGGYERKIANPEVDITFENTIILLGDLEIVVIPCELVAALGKQIKKSSAYKACIVWGYANGQTTYVVEADGFTSGHDGISTWLKRGMAEEYVAKILQNMFD